MTGRLDRKHGCEVVAGAAEVSGVEQGCARGIELGYEGGVAACPTRGVVAVCPTEGVLFRLVGIDRGKVGRGGCPCHISIAGSIDSNNSGVPIATQTPTQISPVDNRTTGRIELENKPRPAVQ